MASVKNRACQDRLEKYKAGSEDERPPSCIHQQDQRAPESAHPGGKDPPPARREMKRVFDLKQVVIFLINRKENLLEVKYVCRVQPGKVEQALRIPRYERTSAGDAGGQDGAHDLHPGYPQEFRHLSSTSRWTGSGAAPPAFPCR